jgi:hypothetical protein
VSTTTTWTEHPCWSTRWPSGVPRRGRHDGREHRSAVPAPSPARSVLAPQMLDLIPEEVRVPVQFEPGDKISLEARVSQGQSPEQVTTREGRRAAASVPCQAELVSRYETVKELLERFDDHEVHREVALLGRPPQPQVEFLGKPNGGGRPALVSIVAASEHNYSLVTTALSSQASPAMCLPWPARVSIAPCVRHHPPPEHLARVRSRREGSRDQ